LRFSGGLLLLIPIDRAESSYQLLSLSLAVFFLDWFFPITDLVSFEAGALARSFSDTCILPL
jgi:hypothetical protein